MPLGGGGYTLPPHTPTPKHIPGAGPPPVGISQSLGAPASSSASPLYANGQPVSGQSQGTTTTQLAKPSSAGEARDSYLHGVPAGGLPFDYRKVGWAFYWGVRKAQKPSMEAYFSETPLLESG